VAEPSSRVLAPTTRGHPATGHLAVAEPKFPSAAGARRTAAAALFDTRMWQKMLSSEYACAQQRLGNRGSRAACSSTRKNKSKQNTSRKTKPLRESESGSRPRIRGLSCVHAQSLDATDGADGLPTCKGAGPYLRTGRSVTKPVIGHVSLGGA